MLNEEKRNTIVRSNNHYQHLFVKYTFAILVDLTILNLFNQYWENVHIADFSTSLLVAILLQLLLQITLKIEHKVANYFNQKEGLSPKIMRIFSAWAILFVSKLLILWVIQYLFGDSVAFHGAMHGVVTFITIVIAIIATEQIIMRINHALGSKIK